MIMMIIIIIIIIIIIDYILAFVHAPHLLEASSLGFGK